MINFFKKLSFLITLTLPSVSFALNLGDNVAALTDDKNFLSGYIEKIQDKKYFVKLSGTSSDWFSEDQLILIDDNLRFNKHDWIMALSEWGLFFPARIKEVKILNNKPIYYLSFYSKSHLLRKLPNQVFRLNPHFDSGARMAISIYGTHYSIDPAKISSLADAPEIGQSVVVKLKDGYHFAKIREWKAGKYTVLLTHQSADGFDFFGTLRAPPKLIKRIPEIDYQKDDPIYALYKKGYFRKAKVLQAGSDFLLIKYEGISSPIKIAKDLVIPLYR